jgi:hypothetical protein
MKTVIDAVNKLEAVWPYNDSLVMYYVSGANGYGFYSKDANYQKGNLVTAFTVEKFNQCVDEMSKAEWIKPAISPTYTTGDKVTLVEDTKLYSCHYDVVYDLSAGDVVTVVGNGVRPDNDAPLVTITNGKGFATLNPDYIAPPIELIHGEAYQFTNIEDNTIKGIYSEDEHSFTGTCVEWSVETCTNIKLLEVKS